MYLTRVWGYAVYIICFTIVTINFEDWAECDSRGTHYPIPEPVNASQGPEPEPEPYLWTLPCARTSTGNDDEYVFEMWLGVLMLAYSAIYTCFMFKHECHQLRIDGRAYFGDVWNLLDITSAVFTLISLAFTLVSWASKEQHAKTHRALDIIQAHALLLGWWKALYFLRGIDLTSFLVNMLLQIARDMAPFLIILAVVLLGFATAFHLMLRHDLVTPDRPNGDEEETMFDQTLTSVFGVVGMMFGAFEVTEFRQGLSDGEFFGGSQGPGEAWISLLDLTVFLLIVPLVMLNALIAIMSDTFDRVKSDAQASKIHDRAELILEMEG